MITASIIADSLNPVGNRLSTFVLRFPRIILAELNTHRAFSRNSASSRAIPFKKMLEMVSSDPFIPIRFQKDHPGMQGVEYFEGEEHEQCVKDWLAARDSAVLAATSFKLPVTKQLRNRLLEPFMWHTAIVSATDFENFFALRAHQDAEIHIAKLAELMLEEYNKSTPKQLEIGEWHVPFGDNIEDNRILQMLSRGMGIDPSPDIDLHNPRSIINHLKRKIAIARCARVSYANFEGKDDYEADIKLCDKLFKGLPKHLSPTEHVAQALGDNSRFGNFEGYKQFRYTFSDQNLTDARVIKK